MKQNKGELQGVGKVFQFTLLQFVKNKANTITLIIMFVLTLFSVPVMTLFRRRNVCGRNLWDFKGLLAGSDRLFGKSGGNGAGERFLQGYCV